MIDAKHVIADINFRLQRTTAEETQIAINEKDAPVIHALIETIVDHINRELRKSGDD